MSIKSSTPCKCPECGGAAQYDVIEEEFYTTTGEMIDDDNPEIVREVATGWYLHCLDPQCGFDDCEPPTW